MLKELTEKRALFIYQSFFLSYSLSNINNTNYVTIPTCISQIIRI